MAQHEEGSAEDEELKAKHGDDKMALQQGDDGALQERKDQPGGRLLAEC
jgi:hypothetical protein